MDGRRTGKLDAPARLVLSLPEGGNLLAMPAADDELAITKLERSIPETCSANYPPSRAKSS